MEWRLFADLADLAGERRVTVAVGPDPTVADALDALLETHPSLADRVLDDDDTLVPSVSLLVEGETVEDLSAPLSGGEEVALLPPASGG